MPMFIALLTIDIWVPSVHPQIQGYTKYGMPKGEIFSQTVMLGYMQKVNFETLT